MTSPIIVVGFAIVVLPSVFLISGLRLSDRQKWLYRAWAIALPVGGFIASNLVVSYELFDTSYGKLNLFEKVISWIVMGSVLFGSWFIYLIGCIRQLKLDHSAEPKTGHANPHSKSDSISGTEVVVMILLLFLLAVISIATTSVFSK